MRDAATAGQDGHDAAMRLLLMRHAKAAAGEGMPDHDRPLTEQGVRDAATMGRWLRDNGAEPDAVWCSSALRVRQTWTAVAAALTGPPEPTYQGSVYQAGPAQLIELVRGFPATAGSALVIGHNPTMEQLLALLTGEATRSMPTGAVAVLELEGSWSAPTGARLAAFGAPGGTPGAGASSG